MSAPKVLRDRILGVVSEQEDGESDAMAAGLTLQESHISVDFDEGAYLDANADVKGHVELGALPSGRLHFTSSGAMEGRIPSSDRSDLDFHVEVVSYTVSGFVFVVGWVRDRFVHNPGIRIRIGFVTATILDGAMVRYRRSDVEQAFHGEPDDYRYGFFALVRLPVPLAAVQAVESGLLNSHVPNCVVEARAVTEQTLLEEVLALVEGRASSRVGLAEMLAAIRAPFGATLDQLWASVLKLNSMWSSEWIGDPPINPKLTIITVIYGRAECIPLHASMLHRFAPPGAVEVIYANNSPELRDTVLQEAELAHEVYGHSLRLVDFAGNTGFGFACNLCAGLARGASVLFLNPDVFPCSSNWYSHVSTALSHSGEALVGARLLYADGSVMHDGMDVVLDRLPPAEGSREFGRILRVDHFSKGSSSWALPNLDLRAVPAVSGALLSVPSKLFDRLGGFSGRYIFGHYEDADLSLRAWMSGARVLVAGEPQFFHFEGKGSVTRPHHHGAATVNRCLFTETWLSGLERIRGKIAEHADVSRTAREQQ